jgi:hypothetical protein
MLSLVHPAQRTSHEAAFEATFRRRTTKLFSPLERLKSASALSKKATQDSLDTHPQEFELIIFFGEG